MDSGASFRRTGAPVLPVIDPTATLVDWELTDSILLRGIRSRPSQWSVVGGDVWGALAAIVQLAPPVYAAFLWRRATATGVIAGLLVGISTVGLLILMPEWKPFGLHEGLVGLAANIITLVFP